MNALFAPPQDDVTAELKRVARAKLDHNNRIIDDNVKLIEAALIRLRPAIASTDMDSMDEELSKIVGSVIGCRSRIQYMRGVWSMYKDAVQINEQEGGS